MNKVFLIGNLTRDPELQETDDEIIFSRLSIAVNRSYTNRDGEKETDFFNVTVWRAQASNCVKYLKKGSKVAITGSLQNYTYEDEENTKRTVTDIIAENVEFLTNKNSQDAEETKICATQKKQKRYNA